MEKQLVELNRRLLQSIGKTYPVGLAQGQMGTSIYFFYLSQIRQSGNDKAIAEQLLDHTLDKLSPDTAVNVEKGLAGVALGIDHLIKAGFVEGNVNELLEDIDSLILKKLSFPEYTANYSSAELVHLLFYLYFRLIEQTDRNSKFIFEETIIKVVNLFYNNLKEEAFNESYSFSVYDYLTPLFLWIMGKLLSLNFYNDRLLKIIGELTPMVLYRFPMLHANRLYLLAGVLEIKDYLQNPQWNHYAKLLHQEIDVAVIVEKEMKNRNIFISNGLSMVYILLSYINTHYPDYSITFNPKDIYDRIIQSDAWNALSSQEFYYNIHKGLLNGFPGVELVVAHIEKNHL